MGFIQIWASVLAALVLAAGVAGCGPSRGLPGDLAGRILAVGAENQYADVVSQVGGPFVDVRAVMSDPNADPHSFEANASVLGEVAAAGVVVQNGLGYDDFMGRIEAASPSSRREVIDVASLLRVPPSTPNPHLWYDPATMPAVAKAVAGDLGRLDPKEAAVFRQRATRFDQSLKGWREAIEQARSQIRGAGVVSTEPVADYLVAAMGLRELTPPRFENAIMNGIDPTPQDISTMEELISGRRAHALVYNEQVADSVTRSLVALARQHGVPVVAVYETMPAGYHYQSWMVAETRAITAAVAGGRSTEHL